MFNDNEETNTRHATDSHCLMQKPFKVNVWWAICKKVTTFLLYLNFLFDTVALWHTVWIILPSNNLFVSVQQLTIYVFSLQYCRLLLPHELEHSKAKARVYCHNTVVMQYSAFKVPLSIPPQFKPVYSKSHPNKCDPFPQHSTPILCKSNLGAKFGALDCWHN